MIREAASPAETRAKSDSRDLLSGLHLAIIRFRGGYETRG